MTGQRTSANVEALSRKRLLGTASACLGKAEMHKQDRLSPCCAARAASGFRRNVPSDGVRRNLVRDGGTIRAETAAAAIADSDDAPGVLSLVSPPSSAWEGSP
ncbi:MAG TPA: hypothetical protein VHZ51_31490 [Ktedonobacteraceae bacterium]|nr:hypothetical protein [Ktedonobacteraceae bacterium]